MQSIREAQCDLLKQIIQDEQKDVASANKRWGFNYRQISVEIYEYMGPENSPELMGDSEQDVLKLATYIFDIEFEKYQAQGGNISFRAFLKSSFSNMPLLCKYMYKMYRMHKKELNGGNDA